MRADYDSEGRTLQIELEPIARLDDTDDATHPRALVHFLDGRPVLVEVLDVAELEDTVGTVAAEYGLDAEALAAAGRAALAAPDRRVTLDVNAHA